ncbi:MAG: beta-propeller fold lactonase family protein, partial [Planctomycetota bacterium]|nr:beta-propeller fold lactonase family protein [Planctomycetota bacterium]
LFPNQPPHLSFPEGAGPRHLVAHPTRGEIFFCINEQGSSVTLLRMDPKKGTLQPLQTVSTLPTDFDRPNACADLEISKDGRFLYGANRGHDSIALFQLLQNDELVRKGIFKTEKTPRQFSLSPDNEFLVSAGQGSDRLAIFRVDPASGRLKRTGTQATGKKPWWITLVD